MQMEMLMTVFLITLGKSEQKEIKYSAAPFPLQILSYKNDFQKSNNDSLNTQVKSNVPVGEEIKFYKTINKIDPVVLRVLMSNITEEDRLPVTPSPHCCYNGGVCHVPSNNTEDRWCTCPSNFTGRYCDIDVDECLNLSACDDHQVCTNTYGSYKCECSQGFVEDNYRCIPKMNCYEDPCKNFASCVERGDGKITCLCLLGYIGDRCQNKIPECEDSSCSEDDICVATATGFQCIKV